MLIVNERIRIPQSEFELTYARSSGPGGQNVNKVNSKATLRWSVTRNATLPTDVRERFLKKYQSRLTADGDLLITGQKYRDQGRNVADVYEKLRAMLSSIAEKPKRRRATRPTAGSVERRIRGKQVTARTKQLRRKPTVE